MRWPKGRDGYARPYRIWPVGGKVEAYKNPDNAVKRLARALDEAEEIFVAHVGGGECGLEYVVRGQEPDAREGERRLRELAHSMDKRLRGQASRLIVTLLLAAGARRGGKR